MLKIHFANKTFTYLNEYMTFNQTIYNNYIFLKQTFVSVKVSENFFIMGVTIFLYLSQLQKLTVACYSIFMKNFDYRCNKIFCTSNNYKKTKQLAVAVINLFYFLIFRRRGAFFCVCFLYLAGTCNRSIFCCIFALLFCRMSFFLSGQEIINPSFVRHYIRHLSAI